MRIRRHGEKTSFAEQPVSHIKIIRQLNAPKMVSIDVRDAIMTSQSVVDEGVICRHECEHTVVFSHLTFKKEAHFSGHGFAEICVEIRKRFGVRCDEVNVPHIQPLPTKIIDQRTGTNISEHATNLRR